MVSLPNMNRTVFVGTLTILFQQQLHCDPQPNIQTCCLAHYIITNVYIGSQYLYVVCGTMGEMLPVVHWKKQSLTRPLQVHRVCWFQFNSNRWSSVWVQAMEGSDSVVVSIALFLSPWPWNRISFRDRMVSTSAKGKLRQKLMHDSKQCIYYKT